MALTIQGITIFLAVLVLGASESECKRQPDEASLQQTHEQWMATHGRRYRDNAEKEARLKIFQENLEYVQNFNSQPNRTFTLSVNPFADMTNDEFVNSRTGGLMVSTLSRPTDTQFYDSLSATSAPSSIDWRQKGAVTSVKDQHNCGSCWAHSAAGAVEALTKIKTGQLPNLSVQELVDCVPRTVDSQGCRYGSPTEAFTYITNNGGITSGSNYPYQAKDGACDKKRASQHAAKISGFVGVPKNNENALMYAVSKQPVAAFVDATGEQFQLYSGGVFSGSCGTAVNHIVLIVGYGTSSDGQKYWLIKNSWGQNWGEGGYIRLQRNSGSAQGRCAIAVNPSYPTA